MRNYRLSPRSIVLLLNHLHTEAFWHKRIWGVYTDGWIDVLNQSEARRSNCLLWMEWRFYEFDDTRVDIID